MQYFRISEHHGNSNSRVVLLTCYHRFESCAEMLHRKIISKKLTDDFWKFHTCLSEIGISAAVPPVFCVRKQKIGGKNDVTTGGETNLQEPSEGSRRKEGKGKKKRPEFHQIRNTDGRSYFLLSPIKQYTPLSENLFFILYLSLPLFSTPPSSPCPKGVCVASLWWALPTSLVQYMHWPSIGQEQRMGLGNPLSVCVFMCLCEAVNLVPLATRWALQERLWWSHYCNYISEEMN